MKLKINYLVIAIIVLGVAILGSLITNKGMVWYNSLNLPTITPAGWVIGLVWTIIFVLSALAIIKIWNNFPRGRLFQKIIGLLTLNGFLNVFWSYLFFGSGLIGEAIFTMILLEATVIGLIIILWDRLKVSAYLLIPYAVWVLFATYLTVIIYQLNKI